MQSNSRQVDAEVETLTVTFDAAVGYNVDCLPLCNYLIHDVTPAQ